MLRWQEKKVAILEVLCFFVRNEAADIRRVLRSYRGKEAPLRSSCVICATFNGSSVGGGDGAGYFWATGSCSLESSGNMLLSSSTYSGEIRLNQNKNTGDHPMLSCGAP